MYKVLLTVLLLIAASCVIAQTVNGTPNFNEIFKQKKTQKRYLRQQIALLQTYYEFLKKGYEISQKGLNLIGQIKNGDFEQHQNYFASLTVVKPAIKNSAEVSVTLDHFVKIERTLDHILSGPYQEEFNSAEWGDVILMCDQIRNQVAMRREDLSLVIADDELQMKDDERLARIDNLRKRAESIHTASVEFSNTIESLWRVRAKERREIKLVRDLNAHGL